MVKNLPAVQETWVWSLGREDPLEKEMATPLQYPCLENPMDRSLVGCSPWGRKESGTTERLIHTHKKEGKDSWREPQHCIYVMML